MSWVRCRTNRSRVRTPTRRPLLFALHRREPHAGVLRPFADRLGIDRLVLLPLHKRLYIGGWTQPNFKAKLGALTGLALRSTTCLQRYRATRMG
jgi:hypothetical protein